MGFCNNTSIVCAKVSKRMQSGNDDNNMIIANWDVYDNDNVSIIDIEWLKNSKNYNCNTFIDESVRTTANTRSSNSNSRLQEDKEKCNLVENKSTIKSVRTTCYNSSSNTTADYE